MKKMILSVFVVAAAATSFAQTQTAAQPVKNNSAQAGPTYKEHLERSKKDQTRNNAEQPKTNAPVSKATTPVQKTK